MLEISVLQFTFALKKKKTQNFPKYIILQQEREEVKLHERENNLK